MQVLKQTTLLTSGVGAIAGSMSGMVIGLETFQGQKSKYPIVVTPISIASCVVAGGFFGGVAGLFWPVSVYFMFKNDIASDWLKDQQ